MNKIVNHVGKFIEKHTAHIQLIFLILLLIVGILFPVIKIDTQTVIFNLILIVGIEILLLLIRYETLQNRINSFLYSESKYENLTLINIDEDSQIFPQMLSQVENDLFISGITCNGIWAYTSQIKEILHKGYEIKILITSDDGIQSNTLIYKGNDFNDSVKNTRNKMKLLWNNIMSDEQLKDYFQNDKLKVKTSKIPFTVAYVATNIYGNDIQKQQIKVTQYIPKHERGECPNIVIDPINNNKLFSYYVNSIKDLWAISEPLLTQRNAYLNGQSRI